MESLNDNDRGSTETRRIQSIVNHKRDDGVSLARNRLHRSRGSPGFTQYQSHVLHIRHIDTRLPIDHVAAKFLHSALQLAEKFADADVNDLALKRAVSLPRINRIVTHVRSFSSLIISCL